MRPATLVAEPLGVGGAPAIRVNAFHAPDIKTTTEVVK